VRPMIRAALRRARFAVGVSRPMVDALARLGAHERAVTVPNGVDHTLFRPRDKARERRALGLPEQGKVVLFVGDLVRDKGAGELCDAWAAVRRVSGEPVHLVMVGEGAMRRRIEGFARALGAPERGGLILAGTRPPTDVALYLGACDLLALPSRHEGMPNVVLEALASARPVVGTRVGGIPEALPHENVGLLVMPRDVDDLARALRVALLRTWDEGAILEAAPPSWEESAARLHEVLLEAAFGKEAVAAARAADRERVWS
jgi:teichuronic acid biosynthesis glycosyltransferase TuaC